MMLSIYTFTNAANKRWKNVKSQNSTDGLSEDDDTSPCNKQLTEMSDVTATSSKKKQFNVQNHIMLKW